MKPFLIAAAALATAQPSAAAVYQAVQVNYEDATQTPRFVDTRQDAIRVAAPGDIDRPVLATVTGAIGTFQAYDLSASAGVFGAIGLNGFGAIPGEYSSTVVVSASDIFNAGAGPARASTRFVIDGGAMQLFAGGNSRIAFNLRLDAEITDVAGNFVFGRTVFESNVSVAMTGANTPPLVTIGGDDISARNTTIGGIGAVVIDPSLQEVDIGILQPNQFLTLSYVAAFEMEIEEFAEIATFQFSDPLSVQFDPNDPDAVRQGALAGANGLPVSLTPAPAVPLPAAAPRLLGGLGLLGLMRRRG